MQSHFSCLNIVDFDVQTEFIIEGVALFQQINLITAGSFFVFQIMGYESN